jgi:hypothetical protein
VVGNTVRMIPAEEVCHFQTADRYARAVTRDAEALIRTPLKELQEQLPRLRRVVQANVGGGRALRGRDDPHIQARQAKRY